MPAKFESRIQSSEKPPLKIIDNFDENTTEEEKVESFAAEALKAFVDGNQETPLVGFAIVYRLMPILFRAAQMDVDRVAISDLAKNSGAEYIKAKAKASHSAFGIDFTEATAKRSVGMFEYTFIQADMANETFIEEALFLDTVNERKNMLSLLGYVITTVIEESRNLFNGHLQIVQRYRLSPEVIDNLTQVVLPTLQQKAVEKLVKEYGLEAADAEYLTDFYFRKVTFGLPTSLNRGPNV